MSNNPFDTSRYDLGTGKSINLTKQDIDSVFKTQYLNPSTTHPCIYCGEPSIVRIIPKEDRFNTAEVEDKGYMCEYCVKEGYLNSEHYGIRPLK